MLYRAIGNVLHHLPAPERTVTMLRRLRTRIEPPRPREPQAVQWKAQVLPELVVLSEAEPFIDVCQAHTLWSRHVGHWSRTTFCVKQLAVKLGKKPWYRPLVSTMRG